MSFRILTKFICCLTLLFGLSLSSAAAEKTDVLNGRTANGVRYPLSIALDRGAKKHLTPIEPVKVSFAWGAEAGGSLDMSAQDMSTIDFSAYFGLKRGWINFFGIGAEIDIMTNNSCRSFPVFVAFRTNFTDRQTLLFLDLRGGQAYNYLPGDYYQTGIYGFGGIGVNLARSKKFCSHIVIGYTFKEYNDYRTRDEELVSISDLHLATFRLGITF